MPRVPKPEIQLLKLVDARVDKLISKPLASVLKEVRLLRAEVRLVQRGQIQLDANIVGGFEGVVTQLNAILERAGMQEDMLRIEDPND